MYAVHCVCAHVRIYGWGRDVQAAMMACGIRTITFGNQLSFQESNSGLQAWQQVVFPTQPSGQPITLFFVRLLIEAGTLTGIEV